MLSGMIIKKMQQIASINGMNNYLERLEVLLDKQTIKSLKAKKVLICGVGGVGSFAAEALARSGIGQIDIVDFDTINPSNLNRQLMTAKNNIGKKKVIVLKERLENISDAKVNAYDTYIDKSFELKDYDYVIDCIDTLKSKFELVKKAHSKNIPIISCLGTAKRISSKGLSITTLDKTKNDPLAKAFRNLVKKENYKKKIKVVYIDAPYIKVEQLGSCIFSTGAAGLFIAENVFKELIK